METTHNLTVPGYEFRNVFKQPQYLAKRRKPQDTADKELEGNLKTRSYPREDEREG